MPYKNKAMARKYKREYMRKYRQFRKRQLELAKRAIMKGNLKRAKQILERKPNISIKIRKSRRSTKRTKRKR